MAAIGENLLVATLETVEVGQVFESVPPHLTLLPWFSVPDLSNLHQSFQDIVDEEFPLRPRVLGYRNFGPENDKRAAELGGFLFAAHARAYRAAINCGAQFDESYMGLLWTPHVTGIDAVAGTRFELNAIQVFAKVGTDQKVVEAVYECAPRT